MRTGGRTSRIISLRAERTALWWSPMRTANGTMCPATTTCPTSARKAQVRERDRERGFGGFGKEDKYCTALLYTSLYCFFHCWPPFVNLIYTSSCSSWYVPHILFQIYPFLRFKYILLLQRDSSVMPLRDILLYFFCGTQKDSFWIMNWLRFSMQLLRISELNSRIWSV